VSVGDNLVGIRGVRTSQFVRPSFLRDSFGSLPCADLRQDGARLRHTYFADFTNNSFTRFAKAVGSLTFDPSEITAWSSNNRA